MLMMLTDVFSANCGRSVALQGLRQFLRRATWVTRSSTTETQQGGAMTGNDVKQGNKESESETVGNFDSRHF